MKSLYLSDESVEEDKTLILPSSDIVHSLEDEDDEDDDIDYGDDEDEDDE